MREQQTESLTAGEDEHNSKMSTKVLKRGRNCSETTVRSAACMAFFKIEK